MELWYMSAVSAATLQRQAHLRNEGQLLKVKEAKEPIQYVYVALCPLKCFLL